MLRYSHIKLSTISEHRLEPSAAFFPVYVFLLCSTSRFVLNGIYVASVKPPIRGSVARNVWELRIPMTSGKDPASMRIFQSTLLWVFEANLITD